MAWRTLSTLDGDLRRTWERRHAAGVAQSRRDPITAEIMVWIGWPPLGVNQGRG